MHRICLIVARLCSAMWVGAGLLFVMTSVTEQMHASFDPATKDTLALIRFPWYYGTGATLIAAALITTRFATLPAGARLAVTLLLGGVLVVMCCDFWFVYRPMRDLLVPPGSGRGGAFERLHTWSEISNAAGFALSAAAAVMLCASRETPHPTRAGERAA
jgi:hypothetical protein